MITSPDRNHQAECSLVLPSTTNIPIIHDENSKPMLKKEEPLPLTIEEITVSQPEATGWFRDGIIVFHVLNASFFLNVFFL